MSSKGPVASGTDGTDFTHRQKVAAHYESSVVNKSRLKFCIFLHYLLFLAMCLKLAEDVLDRLDVFILELEELYIPKPHIWEWLWSSNVLLTFVGLTAIKNNYLSRMKIYAWGMFFLGLCPVIYAMIYYFNDLWSFIDHHDVTKVQDWKGYPVALIWYSFLVVAIQVHFFQLVFAIMLISSWKITDQRRAKQKSN